MCTNTGVKYFDSEHSLHPRGNNNLLAWCLPSVTHWRAGVELKAASPYFVILCGGGGIVARLGRNDCTVVVFVHACMCVCVCVCVCVGV